ncbi:MAG: ATP-binding protein [Bdellovibrionota bacterium]|nr:ATP-binding protein [Bdellovibrionota bacterium]
MNCGLGVFTSTGQKPFLILICGGKESSDSLRSLNTQFRKLSSQNIESKFLNRDVYKSMKKAFIDESILEFTDANLDKEIVLIMLKGTIGEQFMGAGELFDKGGFCLIEAESDSEPSAFAHTFLATGRAHLELSISDMGEFIELFLRHPEEVKTFFNPRNQIVWGALSAQFKEHGLDIKTFKQSFIFEGALRRVHSRTTDPIKNMTQHFKDYVRSLEEDPIELSRLYDSLKIHKSEFFKNPETYEELRTKILPKIFEDNKERIQVWIPACGTGEEAFSFALVLYDFMQENNIQRDTIINVRDAHGELIKSITMQKGHYPLKSLEKIPDRYHQYLDIEKEELSLKHEITSKLIFSPGDLITGARLFGMDIVLCQNILPALKRSFQVDILQKMTVAARAKGFLVTEGDTVLPEEVEENFKKTGEVDNCVFELVKRGNVGKYLGQAETGREYDLAKKRAQKIREEAQAQIDSIQKRKKEGGRLSLDKEKEHLYLDEIDSLQKELKDTKRSLQVAVKDFQKVFAAQVKTGKELKKANIDLEDKNIQMKEMVSKVNTLNRTLEDKVETRTSLLKDTVLELEQSNVELKNSKGDLEKSNQALEKIQNERNFFFANLSHELRTPLNAILGFSQILNNEIKKKEQKEYIESINTSGRSLLRLVNSVHDFTKIELNELKVEKKKCNLGKIIKSISLYFKNEVENKGLSFESEFGNNVPSWIESDELALKQVLDNLLSNSLKFTKKGHIKLKVEAQFKEDRENSVDLTIKVEDTGFGMPPEKVKTLFEPFSQVHEHGSIQERGSGLGLFIADKVIRDLGGRLHAISSVGIGSCFSIDLPDVTFLREEGQVGETSYTFFGDTVLIADDFPINIKLYQAYLSQHNLKVEIARDGKELLEKARSINPDLILTDFHMPELNANEVLKLLEDNIEAPFVLVSALKINEATKKGFQGFLQKPVDEDSFIKEVAKFLKHEVTIIEEEKKFESYEFDIPENLSEEDVKLTQEVHQKLKNWRFLMPISEIESDTPGLRKKVKMTKLNVLIHILEKLEESAKNFNIDLIKSLLDQVIEKTQK